MKLISIVIPICNEESNIAELVTTLDQNLSGEYSYEYLFIDDGSTDKSLSKLLEISNFHPRLRIISFTRNFGHQSAILAGLENASGDAIITMDADLQDPPEILHEFIRKWQDGVPIVLGRRIIRNKDSFYKRASAWMYYKLLNISTSFDVHEQVGDFRLLDKKAAKVLCDISPNSGYLRGLIAWTGYKYAFVDYERPKRLSGKTKYTFSRMLNLAMDGFFNFSTVPLKLGLILGIISIGMGIFFLGYIFYDTLINNEIYPLFKWLTVTLFMFTGFLFILIWLLSEYIIRIYNASRNRPNFIIKDEINSKAQHEHSDP